MISTPIEVVIEDGRISAVGPRELPASGRGLLTLITDAPDALTPVQLVEKGGRQVFAKTGRVITCEMVKEIEASTW